MLESKIPGRARRVSGQVLAAGFVLACSTVAWAMQAPREIQAAQTHDVQPERANVEEGVHPVAGGADRVSVSVNWPGDRVLGELARVTGRTLDIDEGVAGWTPVTLQLVSVPASTVAGIVQDTNPGVRISMDERAIRVSSAE